MNNFDVFRSVIQTTKGKISIVLSIGGIIVSIILGLLIKYVNMNPLLIFLPTLSTVMGTRMFISMMNYVRLCEKSK